MGNLVIFLKLMNMPNCPMKSSWRNAFKAIDKNDVLAEPDISFKFAAYVRSLRLKYGTLESAYQAK